MKKETAKKNIKKVVGTTGKAKTHPLIRGPRITEKSALGSERGIYTFNVENEANKSEIKKAIKMIYGITPKRVSITQITSKNVVRRGIKGIKGRGKKAVVYLKSGDKIAFA